MDIGEGNRGIRLGAGGGEVLERRRQGQGDGEWERGSVGENLKDTIHYSQQLLILQTLIVFMPTH